jgi:hypothetical protein
MRLNAILPAMDATDPPKVRFPGSNPGGSANYASNYARLMQLVDMLVPKTGFSRFETEVAHHMGRMQSRARAPVS